MALYREDDDNHLFEGHMTDIPSLSPSSDHRLYLLLKAWALIYERPGKTEEHHHKSCCRFREITARTLDILMILYYDKEYMKVVGINKSINNKFFSWNLRIRSLVSNVEIKMSFTCWTLKMIPLNKCIGIVEIHMTLTRKLLQNIMSLIYNSFRNSRLFN